MPGSSDDQVAFLTMVSIGMAAVGFAYYGVELDVFRLEASALGNVVVGMVATLGFGLMVTRALADPGEGSRKGKVDRRFLIRSIGVAGSFGLAGVLALVETRMGQPNPSIASLFYGLLLGHGALSSILLWRRVRPPFPAPPPMNAVGELFGDLLDTSHLEVLSNLVEAGEIDPEDLPNADYEQMARWLAARGHPVPHDEEEWNRRLLDRQRRRENKTSSRLKRSGPHPPITPRQASGREQRGFR